MNDGLILLLAVLGLLIGVSDAFRKDWYEVGSEDISRPSLRGNGSTRQRVASPKRQPHHNSKSGRNLPEGYNAASDPGLIGEIEDRRFKAMDAMFEGEKLMFTLRFSMSMSMDMSMPLVS